MRYFATPTRQYLFEDRVTLIADERFLPSTLSEDLFELTKDQVVKLSHEDKIDFVAPYGRADKCVSLSAIEDIILQTDTNLGTIDVDGWYGPQLNALIELVALYLKNAPVRMWAGRDSKGKQTIRFRWNADQADLVSDDD